MYSSSKINGIAPNFQELSSEIQKTTNIILAKFGQHDVVKECDQKKFHCGA